VRTTRWMTLLAGALFVVTSACSSPSPPAASSAPPGGGAAAPQSSASAGTPSPTQSAVAAIANACQVLTQSEASALSGVSMPAGVQQPWGSGGAVKCGYTSGPVEAFVILDRASTAAEAQAQWDSEKANLQAQATPAGVSVTATAVPGIGDRAEVFVGNATIGGVKNTIMAIFALKGATFVDLGDFALQGSTPPTTAALEAQAMTSVGRV